MSEPAAPQDKERYPGEVHWYDLPDDDAVPEDEDPTDPPERGPTRGRFSRWRLPRLFPTVRHRSAAVPPPVAPREAPPRLGVAGRVFVGLLRPRARRRRPPAAVAP